jgi:peptidoglycan hydrolase-like protein with peptidoglycan-binding domain
MRRLLVTAASLIALGLGGIGAASAQSSNPGQSGSSGSSMPPAAAMPSSGTATGTSRSDIVQAQQQLRADHLYQGRIDGRFGPQTRSALRRFQQQNHLPVTARLDRSTMNRLIGGTTGQGSSRPTSSTAGQGANPPASTMGEGSSTKSGGTPLTPSNPPYSGTGTAQTPSTGTQDNQK